MAFRTAAQLVIPASEKLRTDQNATQSEKRLMNVGSFFAADAQFGGCWKEKSGEIHRNEPSVKARQNIECGLERAGPTQASFWKIAFGALPDLQGVGFGKNAVEFFFN
jgi:hypothetical protein